MIITILRHGMPDIESSDKLSAVDFGQWVEKYNAAGISREDTPPVNTIDSIKENSFVVCSHLPRSIESANILGFRNIDIQNPIFRECEMPYANWNFPKMPVMAWSVIFRVLQLFGYSSNAESFREARERAGECTAQLLQYANENESVLFVGHGSLNWLIHKRLLKLGWQGPKKSGRKHWGVSVYKYSEHNKANQHGSL